MMSKGAQGILVFGKSGQVARALAERAGPDWFFADRNACDLSDAAAIRALIRQKNWKAVINAAAYTAVDMAESDPVAARAVNAIAPGQMARQCAEQDVPFIHLSTDYVFDGTKEEPHAEDDVPCPINVYGRSKLAGERLVMGAGGAAVILRTSWVYAPEGRNFVHTMLRLGQERDELSVVADQIGAPTSAHQIADGICQVLNNLLTSPSPVHFGVFHMTAAGETSWHGFAEEIFAQAKAYGYKTPQTVKKIPSAAYPVPAQRPANSRLDCSRIARAHGVRLADWRDGLRTCMETIAANGRKVAA